MATAGGSARAEYERRRAIDRDRRRRTRKPALALLALTPVVVYALVRAGAAALNHWLISTLFHQYVRF